MKNNIYTPNDFFAEARNEAEVNNLLNNDVYKFMMLDFILATPKYRWIEVKRKLKIRSKNIKTAEVIPKDSLIKQLELAKNMPWITEAQASYLRWMTRPDGQRLFREETIEFLKNFKFWDYTLWTDENWNYELEFTWPWEVSMMWEIIWLKLINSSYLYNYVSKDRLTNIQFNKIINETLHRLYEDIEIFKSEAWFTFSEFGTRRAFSTDLQRTVMNILLQELPNSCLWTSNVMIASELGQANPRGTNAHELRIIPTALYDNPEDIISEMYEVDRAWAKHFPWLSILLPDTYGSSFYFKNCPEDIIKNHNGCRFDSKDPMVAIPEYVNWILENKENPQTKIWIPSDGLDAKTAVEIYKANKDKIWKLTFGIWTNLTNNTKNTYPIEETHGDFGSFSVVIKPSEVKRPDGTWVSCVKLSDNPTKATWSKDRVELFKKIFWVDGVEEKEVNV